MGANQTGRIWLCITSVSQESLKFGLAPFGEIDGDFRPVVDDQEPRLERARWKGVAGQCQMVRNARMGRREVVRKRGSPGVPVGLSGAGNGENPFDH